MGGKKSDRFCARHYHCNLASPSSVQTLPLDGSVRTDADVVMLKEKFCFQKKVKPFLKARKSVKDKHQHADVMVNMFR